MRPSSFIRCVVLFACVVGSGILGARLLPQDDAGARLAKARDLLAAGKPADAATLLDAFPGDPAKDEASREARALRVRAFVAAKEWERAVATGLDALNVLPESSPWRGRIDADVARALEGKGDGTAALGREADTAESALSEASKGRLADVWIAWGEKFGTPRPGPSGVRPPVPANRGLKLRCLDRAIAVLEGTPRAIDARLAKAEYAVDSYLTSPMEWPVDLDAARKAVDAMTRAKEDGPRLARGRLVLGKSLRLSGNAVDARAVLAALRAMPDDSRAAVDADAALELGEAWVATNEGGALDRGLEIWATELARTRDAARAAVLRRRMADVVLVASAGKDPHPRALSLLLDVADAVGAPPADVAWARYHAMYVLKALQRWDEARVAGREFLARFPADARVPEVQREVSRMLILKGDAAKKSAEAVAAYREFLEEYPLDPWAPLLSVRIALVLVEDGAYAAARDAATSARDRWRKDAREMAAEAGVLVGELNERRLSDLDGAVAAYRLVVEQLGDTKSAQKAREHLARLESIDLGLDVARTFAPGEPVRVGLRTRNVKEVVFRVYKLDAKAYFDRKGTLSGTNDIDVALVKADATFSYPVKDFVRYRGDTSEVVVPNAEEGAWVVTAEAEQRRAAATLFVTRARIVTKQHPGGVFAWVTDAESGNPAQGVEVLARNGDFKTSAVTAADGTARLAIPAEKAPCEVIALVGKSVTPGFAQPIPAASAEGLVARLHWVLDRPVVRPNDVLRFAAFLREPVDGVATSVEGRKGVVVWTDPRGRVFETRDVVTGPFGRFEGEVSVPESGTPGTWKLQATFGASVFTEDVTVRVFTTPEFRVAVTPAVSVVAPGDEVAATVRVAAWAGGAVPGARVDWVATAAPAEFDGSKWREASWWYRAVEKSPPARPGASVVAEGAGTCDDSGTLSIAFRTENVGLPRRYLVQAYVRDSAAGFISGSGSFVAAFTPGHVVVIPDRRAYRAGDRMTARLVGVDWTSSPLELSGELEVVRRSDSGKEPPVSVRATVALAANGEAEASLVLPAPGSMLVRYTGTDAKGRKVVGEWPIEVTGERPDLAKEVRLLFEREAYGAGTTARAWVDAPASGMKALLTFEGEGVLEHRIVDVTSRNFSIEHLLGERLAPNVVATLSLWHDHALLTAQDPLVVLRQLEVTVTPSATETLPGTDVALDVLVRDQTGRPAEAAVALAVSDAALEALGLVASRDPRYTFNRDVRPHRTSTGSSASWRQKVEAVALDRDVVSRARLEAERFAVAESTSAELADRGGESEMKERRLAERGEAGPGGAEDGVAKDQKPGGEKQRSVFGAPAPSAAAPGAPTVGGGGGAVGGRPAGGARAARRGGQAAKSKGNGELRKADDAMDGDIPTITAGLFKDLEKNDADKWASDARPMLGFALGTAGDTQATPEPTVRTRFADVAAWHPTLVTGKDGRARVTLKLPDNLTSWTAAAVAVDVGVSAGAGSATIRAAQPVSVRLPMPPAFLHTDAWRAVASIRNATPADVTMAFEARSVDPTVVRLEGRTSADLPVKAGATTDAEFLVWASKPGIASFALKAAAGSAGDAVTITRPIRAFGEPWDGGARAAITDGTTFDVDVPALVEGSLNASIVVQADLATDLLEGVTLLAEARGGGLETTANRVVASLALHRALAAAGRPSFVAIDRIEASARALVREIRARLGDDGLVRDGSDLGAAPLTALCAETLARLRDFGIDVPADLVRQVGVGAEALLARGGASASPDDRAWLVLGLAMLGQPRPNALTALAREGDALAPVSLGRAVVAAALMNRDAVAASFLGLLRNRRRPGDGMPFPKASPAWFNAEQEAAAWAILAHRRAGGREDEIAALVKALRRSLAIRGCFHTRAAASAVIALAEVAAAAPVFDGDVEVAIDGIAVASPVRLSAAKPFASVALPVDRLGVGKHRVEVRKSGAGEATVRLRLLGVKPATVVPPAGNLITVSRQLLPYREPDRAASESVDGFESVVPAKRPSQADAESVKESFVGAKLTVRLVVEARDEVREVVLEDPWPAGCEPVEAGLRAALPPPTRRESGWMFRIPVIPKGGRVVVTYPLICGLAGTFSAMPAEARAFYDPEIRGASASLTLAVFEDPERMTREPLRPAPPDVRIETGRKAFAERRWADAVFSLRGLTKDFVLRDELADEVLAMLQVAHAMLKQGQKAVAVRDELLARNPRAAVVGGQAALALGRAYVEAGDVDRARELFRQVREEIVDLETAQAAELSEMATERADLIAIVDAAALALMRWPTEGKVPALELEAAGRWMTIEDPASEGKVLPPERRVMYGRALEAYARVAAWNAGAMIAERASQRRLDILGGLGTLERFHVEASNFAERFPESASLDTVLADDASALFGLKRFDEASARARKVLETAWPIRAEPGVVRGKSGQHARMAALLGKIAHVAGRLDEAVARYAEAKDAVPDALVSYAFLTRRSLSTPGIVTVAPKSTGVVSVAAKNVEKVTVMIYPVDLGVLFAVRKSFDALNRADLSGITPATSVEHALGLRKYVGGSVDVKLPELAEGAYLAVVTDGERSTTTLVVVTALTLRVDRVDGDAYAYLTDGEGRPVEGARVSLGVDGRVVHCGDTDQRGAVRLGTIPDRVTVVAEKGVAVAVTRE